MTSKIYTDKIKYGGRKEQAFKSSLTYLEIGVMQSNESFCVFKIC